MGHFCSGLYGQKLTPTQMLYIAMADRNPRFVFQTRRWGRRWWPCLGHNTTLGWISIKLLDLVPVSCVSEGVIVFYLLCLIYAPRKLISTLLGYGIIMLKKIRRRMFLYGLSINFVVLYSNLGTQTNIYHLYRFKKQ